MINNDKKKKTLLTKHKLRHHRLDANLCWGRFDERKIKTFFCFCYLVNEDFFFFFFFVDRPFCCPTEQDHAKQRNSQISRKHLQTIYSPHN